jgi:acyl-lipid omega-6 desaturase (Delta-12 desaturase)
VSSVDQVKLHKREIVNRYAQADDARGLFQALATVLPLALLWWAVVLSSQYSLWLTACLVPLIALFTLRVFVLMHDAGHGSLFRSQRLNRGFGFVFGVLTGMPQYVWSQHHSFHHRNNGNWEVYRGPLTTPSTDEFAAFTPAQRSNYCFTRHIVMAPLGGFIYLLFNPRFTWIKGSLQLLLFVARAKWREPDRSLRDHASAFHTRYWKSAREYWHMTWNNLALLALCALMSWAVGAALFFGVYVISVSLAGGAGIVLFTVQHNFKHSYAAASANWDCDAGAVHGTSFLMLPAWLNWFTANIAFHHVHHLSSAIPNYRLRACHQEYAHVFTEVTRVRLLEVATSLKYILWDTRAERIISLSEYEMQDRSRPS